MLVVKDSVLDNIMDLLTLVLAVVVVELAKLAKTLFLVALFLVVTQLPKVELVVMEE